MNEVWAVLARTAYEGDELLEVCASEPLARRIAGELDAKLPRYSQVEHLVQRCQVRTG